jgi:hypothetical protein
MSRFDDFFSEKGLCSQIQEQLRQGEIKGAIAFWLRSGVNFVKLRALNDWI